MGSNGDTSDVSVTPVDHKFGDEELSDVTFIVGGEHFKCHKMFLAVRSPYFKAMFCSNFKEKDQNEVSIVADPAAFNQLMEIVYTGHLSGWKALLNCKPYSTFFGKPGRAPKPPDVSVIWTRCHTLMALADQFGILKSTVTVLENYFLRSIDGKEHEDYCGCGIKLIVAVMYGMEDYKTRSPTTRNAVANAMTVIKKIQPNLTLDPMDLQWLLQRE